MSKLVTIFIPTHNRKELLLRNLKWLDKSGCQVVIADSSDISCESEIRKLNSSKSYRGSIQYLHQSNIDYYSKIVLALKKVKTPYCVMCPDDDFIIWKNIKYLVAEAVKSNAKTVVARDLSLKCQDNYFEVCESSEYRRYGIKDQNHVLSHIKSGMSPIVCTYYQLHETSMLKDLWSHIEKNKSLMPGNKLVEIVFRSGCFINGPVVFCNRIFRVLGDAPPLRSYDQSEAIQKYILNFEKEVKNVQESGKFPEFVHVIASYLNKYHPSFTAQSNKIALDLIVNPMFRRMHLKHEILWKSRYSLGFDFSSKKDVVYRSQESLKYVYGMQSHEYRLPECFMNLSSFFLSSKDEWSNFIDLLCFCNQYKIHPKPQTYKHS